jgi:peptidoglycan/LPS O-acetylase OafA/YrhL
MLNTVFPRDMPGTRTYYPELDGVRAIAALMVMAFHFPQAGYSGYKMSLGQTGVDLFFVLSGFLITTILLSSPLGDWYEIRNFYIRRVLRIFPLYYGFLILASIMGGMVSLSFWIYLQNIAMAIHLPGTHGPPYFWSLAVEEQFYLVWPFLILFLPRRWLAVAMWGAVGMSVTLRVLLIHSSLESFYFTFSRLDGLASGGLLALYNRDGELSRRRPVLLGLAAISVIALGIGWKVTQGQPVFWVQPMKISSATGLYAAFVGLLLTSSGTAAHRFLRSNPMRAIGRVSYGLYVYHPVILDFTRPYLARLPFILNVAISFAAVYSVSFISFHVFEKRFTDMKQKFAPEKPFKEVAA